MKPPVNSRFWRARAARPECLTVIAQGGEVYAIMPVDEEARRRLLEQHRIHMTRRAEWLNKRLGKHS